MIDNIEQQFEKEEVACYDLAEQPATFDIVNWLAAVATLGAKHVRFATGAWKKKNYTVEDAEQRYNSILKPSVGLFGLEFSEGPRYGCVFPHTINATLAVFKNEGRIAKITIAPRPKDYVTITLRRSRTPGRDSNEPEWREFAARLTARGTRVLILRDYDEVPLELTDRMRLYAGAKMNFFVSNGPAMCCILSEIPYLIMRYICGPKDVAASPQMMKLLGIEPGFQYPWANAHQRLSYELDTADNIEAEYAAMPKADWRIAA
jgi:hypothetical protein